MMLSQAKRAKLESRVIRPRSRTLARKTREVSKIASEDEEAILTTIEPLLDSDRAIVIADDDPVDSQLLGGTASSSSRSQAMNAIRNVSFKVM